MTYKSLLCNTDKKKELILEFISSKKGEVSQSEIIKEFENYLWYKNKTSNRVCIGKFLSELKNEEKIINRTDHDSSKSKKPNYWRIKEQ